MKGDFSRLRDNRGKGYSRVMMQQGRVLLDSDWNEQAALMQEMVRLLARDLYGAHGGPGEDPGFRIFYKGQKSAEAIGVWNSLQRSDEIMKAFADGTPIIGPGRYYVHGRAVANKSAAAYTAEAEDPFGGAPTTLDISKTPWLAYLDVWEDYVSPEQDINLVEIALGGPDTCGRAKTMWKVRIKQGKTQANLSELEPTGGGLLAAFTDEKPQSEELCVISPDHQYRGIENQLYRVEIHKGGKEGEACFKWSRDNGAAVYPVLGHPKGNMLELAHLGRDKLSSLPEGGWVEYVDDDLIARAGAGVMARVEKIDRDDNRVKLKFEPGFSFNEHFHPLLRRWDHVGGDDGRIKIKEGDSLALEDGIRIKFAKVDGAAFNYRAGDYWLIPARVATGEVDWPVVNSVPVPQSPHGPLHSYAPLLLVDDANGTDCRIKCEMKRTEMKSS